MITISLWIFIPICCLGFVTVWYGLGRLVDILEDELQYGRLKKRPDKEAPDGKEDTGD